MYIITICKEGLPQDLDEDKKDNNSHYKGEDDEQKSAVIFLG